MDKKRIVFVISLISILVFFNIQNSPLSIAQLYAPRTPRTFENYYSTFENIGNVSHLDGFIFPSGCKQLGGRIVIGTIDAKPVPVTALCEFNDYYFKLMDDTGLAFPAVVGQWTDPKTGKTYELGRQNIPSVCNAPGTLGIYADNSYNADEVTNTIPISADGKEFQVKFNMKGIERCSHLLFIQEEKKISIQSFESGHAIITTTIPKELLSGEFTVLLDGNSTDYTLERTESDSTVNVEFDYPDISFPNYSIDIVGTEVIPEFPALSLTILGIALSIVLFTRLIPKLNKKMI